MRIFEKWKQGLQWMKIQDGIGEPPWEYDFLYNLPESELPKYLKKIFKYRTGEDLPLKYDFKLHNWIIDKKGCKTFNQKIQWIKLYGITDLMRNCADKVKVRDYVREKIGAEYLKPVLQLVRSEESGVRSNNLNFSLSTLNTPLFDKIDFEKLPDSFVIKCAHGCKWHYIIKNKKDFLNNKRLFDIVKRNITGWLEQEFFPWNGFEMQYAKFRRVKLSEREDFQDAMEPKLLIEPFMRENRHIEAYCFNGRPRVFADVHIDSSDRICTYNEDFTYSDLVLSEDRKLMQNFPADEILKQSIDLSKKLSKDFRFVRVDWMCHEGKLYFEELTFTPYSGFGGFDKKWNLKLGNWIA